MTDEPIFLDVEGVPIAVRRRAGRAPGLVWLGGFKSDMKGSKAEALDAWAAASGSAFLRHDYSGHGESGGDFNDGTISRWLAESLSVFRTFSEGPRILVGSSMGAWIALRMLQELLKAGETGRAAGLLLIAPAPDFTFELIEPQLKPRQKKDLQTKGYFERPSDYAGQPYRYTRALIEDGRANRVLDGIIETHCPVHVLQGMKDADVPYQHALKLLDHLPADDVTLSLVRDGDHRLSRPQDLDMIVRSIEGLLERIA